VSKNGISLLLMWPSVETFLRLSTLHQRSANQRKAGVVTAIAPSSTGKSRVILEIDNRPAAQVYDEWTDGAIGRELILSDIGTTNVDKEAGARRRGSSTTKFTGNVLAASTNYPLGHVWHPDRMSGARYTSLIHPFEMKLVDADDSTSDGGRIRFHHALEVFAEVGPGDELACYEAQTEQLISSLPGNMKSVLRASGFVVAGSDKSSGDGNGRGSCADEAKLHGALVIYCGGMMMRVADVQKSGLAQRPDKIGEVAEHIGNSLGGNCPWVGQFTFGEQGPARAAGLTADYQPGCGQGGTENGSGINVHGNLMINCLLFGEQPRKAIKNNI
jgi:hypothetical protein